MRINSSNEGLRWLTQSQADLDDARYLYEGGRYNACCFFCQQAADKAIKAYLFQQGAEHIYGHSVAELRREAAKLNRAFADLKSAIAPLDPTRGHSLHAAN